MQKNEAGPLPDTIHKNSLKDLNVSPKTIKLLDENIGQTRYGNDFLNMTPKAQAAREKKRQIRIYKN